MSKRPHKVIFAAGGTGGHLFPAQGLAEQMLKQHPGIDLSFAGAKLSENAYFDKVKYPFRDIPSATPLRGNIFKAFRSIGSLFQGIVHSLALLSEKKPDLVIGFGSFHAFPVLCAAVIKKIPLILFESNSIPGKVIKLFSKRAIVTAVYFEEAKQHLKGKTIEVEIPIARQSIPKEQACRALGLDPSIPTLLVFGGSQGAKQINHHLVEALPLLKSFQLIHLTGNEEMAKQVNQLCATLQIPCYAKKFEADMEKIWSAADFAVCRSGAMTVSEILHYEVPAILIPYPTASDQHQLKNALFMEQKVGGAILCPESSLSTASLCEKIIRFAILEKKERIVNFKKQNKKENLGGLITKFLIGEQ